MNRSHSADCRTAQLVIDDGADMERSLSESAVTVCPSVLLGHV